VLPSQLGLWRRCLAGVALALPWLDSLPARGAESGKLVAAAATQAPVRFACIYFSNGVEPVHWRLLTTHAVTTLAEAREVVRAVALKVPAWEVCKTALALYLMEKFDGRRFQDDTAFRYQLCQCLRRLSPSNYRSYFNAAGKVRASHLKDMHRQAIELLGDWLVPVFGLAGAMFANWVERVDGSRRHAR
jgi:hypothetical protein